MSAVPDRVLVLGLARSGRAAVAALRHEGVDVVAYDANEELDARRDRRGRPPRHVAGRAARRRRPRGEEPRYPGPGATGAGARERADPGHLGDRARRAARPEPDRRDHGHEREDDDDGARGGDVRCGGIPVEVAGNIGRPLTSIVGQRQPRRVGDVRALVLPARGRRDTAARDGGAPEPRARPPRPPRRLRRLPGREAPRSSRTRARTTSPSSRAGSAPSRAGRRVEFTGADPLPAEPRIPGAHNRENAAAATAAARAAGIGDDAIAEALRTFPGVEHRIEDVGTVAASAT